MKHADRIVILLLNICLVALAILAPALLIAKSPAYYRFGFDVTGIYEENGVRTPIRYIGGRAGSVARFSDGQLDEISAHIIDFLFGDTEDFTLVMDGVLLNGETRDGVSVFGEEAVSHMRDVKELMQLAERVAMVALCLLPLLFLYICIRPSARRRALPLTLLFYLVILLLVAAFLYITVSGGSGDLASDLWVNIHHLFFPFRPDKVAGSFFNDALTSILTVPFFMTAVVAVAGILVLVSAAWVILATVFRYRSWV